MATTTFTLRLNPRDHELLAALAAMGNQSIADLAREMINEGIQNRLDPEEIEKRVAAERERLLAAAKELRDSSSRSMK